MPCLKIDGQPAIYQAILGFDTFARFSLESAAVQTSSEQVSLSAESNCSAHFNGLRLALPCVDVGDISTQYTAVLLLDLTTLSSGIEFTLESVDARQIVASDMFIIDLDLPIPQILEANETGQIVGDDFNATLFWRSKSEVSHPNPAFDSAKQMGIWSYILEWGTQGHGFPNRVTTPDRA
ncbi:MAG: hypothetical protein AAF512_26285, partial [Pseudomonadota bacterium]